MKHRLLFFLVLWISLGFKAQTPVYLDDTQAVADRVEDAMQRMTPAEKEALAETYFQPCSSGVPRLGIPPFVMDTQPNPMFPSVASLLNSWNPELLRQLGRYRAEQALYRRIDLIGDATPPEQGEDPFLVSRMLPLYEEGVRPYGIALKDDMSPIGAPQPQDERLRRLLQLYF